MRPSDKALIIFTRNPQLGKGKRRLAASVGDQAAHKIYLFLLEHTRKVTAQVDAVRQVWYSEEAPEEDLWDKDKFDKFTQQGNDLGERMYNAFAKALITFPKAIIIGSDLYDLSAKDIELAFDKLDHHDAVIGPAEDGGYYLLGFKNKQVSSVFANKNWGTDTVYRDTRKDLEAVDTAVLDMRNDVDYYEDIANHPDFQKFLKHMHA